MFRLLVDFNEIRNDRVAGLQQYAESLRPLQPGDRVLVHDDGEEEAWGVVERVDGDLVDVGIDWSTFGPAGRFEAHSEPTGVWWVADRGSALMQAGQPKLLQVIGLSGDAEIRDEEEHSADAASPTTA